MIILNDEQLFLIYIIRAGKIWDCDVNRLITPVTLQSSLSLVLHSRLWVDECFNPLWAIEGTADCNQPFLKQLCVSKWGLSCFWRGCGSATAKGCWCCCWWIQIEFENRLFTPSVMTDFCSYLTHNHKNHSAEKDCSCSKHCEYLWFLLQRGEKGLREHRKHDLGNWNEPNSQRKQLYAN